MRLRGYDEYEVTLGDEMRGERACLGKSLEDAERDLRIKAHVIRAIEDCDLDYFPNDSVVAGYVRSYARYLGLDPEACYRRFCAESGFRSPVSSFVLADHPDGDDGARHIGAAAATAGAALTQSRFAVKPAPARLSARVNLGGLTSALAMLALVCGLGYGGYVLLQDIQRVGFAPLPQAPQVVAETPLIAPPSIESGMVNRPDVEAYQGDGVLAAIAPAEMAPPPLPPRDGPISAIDPATSGMFHEPAPMALVAEDEMAAQLPVAAEPTPDGPSAARADAVERPAAQPVHKGPPKIAIQATDAAWIRVRDGDLGVVFEGTLFAGDRFDLPDRVATPLLRVGNAGAVFVLVDGAPYGPLGRSGRVVKNLSLLPTDITSQVPQASADAINLRSNVGAGQHAAALASE
jgi:cytoskeleton protein RodZ